MSKNKIFINTEKLPEPLSNEETIKLFQIRDKESKEKIIIHNMRFVIYIVNRMNYSEDYNINDLISTGNLGLLKAVKLLIYQKI